MEYFDKLISTVPYNLKYNFEVDLSSLMKAISVETDMESDSLLEKLLQYVKLMNQICGIDIFVIPNLKYYFSTEETMQFYQFAMYNKIYMVVIEPTLSPHMKDWYTFESFVNSERCKTVFLFFYSSEKFESFVNL